MGQIVVEGPDGKKYAFPDTMPREQINAFLRNKYGTKTRDETATQYLQRIGREQKAAEDLRRSKEAQIRDVERVAAGTVSEGAMSNPGAFYLAGPSAMQSGREASAPIYKGANMVPEDQAFAGGMANAAGLWLPEMLSEPYREGLARARSDQPGWTMAGDFAGGVMSGEVIGAGLQAGIRAVAPRVRQLGAMFKGGKAAADDARLLESIRDPRMLTEGGDPIANARLLDEWQVPADQAAYPMGFFGGKKPAADQIPSVTISPEERAMLTGEAPKGSARTVTAKEAASQTADPEYMAARKQAFLSPEEIATLLDAPSDIKPGGFDVTRPSVTKRKYGTESFSDPRLSVDQNKAVEMRKNGYTVREIADEMDTSEDVVYHHFMAARRKGVEMGGIAKDNTTVDILTLKEKGLKPREIAERLGVPRNQVNVMLAQARRRIEASGSELPPWLVPGKGGRPMGPAVGDFAENVFGAGVSSAMGSAPTVDINGDGVIDETDRMLGAGAGLALWASPMGLRQAAKLGGMMKGTKSQGLSGLPKTPQQAAKFETPGSPEWEAAKAKGLDMSQAGRMARAKEMGFDTDTVLYHGTDKSFDAFDPEKIGSRTDGGHYGRGIYFASTKGEASYYGDQVGEYYVRGRLLDLGNDTGDLTFRGHFKSFAPKLKAIGALDAEQSQALDAILAAEKYVDDNVVLLPAVSRDGTEGWFARVKNPAQGYSDNIEMRLLRDGAYPKTKQEAVERLKDSFISEMERFHKEVFPGLGTEAASLSDYVRVGSRGGASGLTAMAKKAGYDGIRYGDETIIFDPSNIRSVNAAFDPDKAASPILTAGVGGK